jgi:hypothetical protein
MKDTESLLIQCPVCRVHYYAEDGHDCGDEAFKSMRIRDKAFKRKASKEKRSG